MSESEYAMAQMADAKVSEKDGVKTEERVQAHQEQKQSASVEVVEGPGVSSVRQQQVQQSAQQTQQQSSSVQSTTSANSSSVCSVKSSSSTVSSTVKSSSVSSSVKSSSTSIKSTAALQAKSLLQLEDVDF